MPVNSDYNLAPRSDDPKLYAKQVAKMVQDRWEFAKEDSITIRRNMNRYYDLYRGFIKSRSQPFRNQVHLPLLFSAIEVGVAIKHGLLTSQTPFVEFLPGGPEDSPSARRTTALVQQQFDDADVDTKLATLLRMGDISGTAVYQWSWKTVKNVRPQRVPMPGDPTGMMFAVMDQEMVDFDGPWVDVVDCLDIAFAPGFQTIRDMPWIIRRYWIDLDDLKMLASGDSPVFDASGVDELSGGMMPEDSASELEGRRFMPGGLRWSVPSSRVMDKYSKPVEILEMHGTIPSELMPDDGHRNRLITVGNGSVVLRNVPNPQWSNGLPFGVYSPTPDPYSIYGIGKVEPNDKLQATASRLASQKLDALDYLIDPMMAYNQLANVQTQKLYARPGGLVGGDGDPRTWLMPISADMRGLQQGIAEIESLWRWIQHGTGVSEEAIGMTGGVGSDRQTAREFLGKMENVQRRMVREALHAADAVLIPLAEAFRALDSQFCPFPKVLRMLGQNALIDPQTGMPIPPDQSIGLQDVVLRYDMRAAAATSLIGKSAQQQNAMLLTQSVTPFIQAGMINPNAFLRWLFKTFDVQSPDDMIMPMNPMMAQMMAMASMQAGQPVNPNSSGQPGGTISSPNSDILDQMVSPGQGMNPSMGGIQ